MNKEDELAELREELNNYGYIQHENLLEISSRGDTIRNNEATIKQLQSELSDQKSAHTILRDDYERVTAEIATVRGELEELQKLPAIQRWMEAVVDNKKLREVVEGIEKLQRWYPDYDSGFEGYNANKDGKVVFHSDIQKLIATLKQ